MLRLGLYHIHFMTNRLVVSLSSILALIINKEASCKLLPIITSRPVHVVPGQPCGKRSSSLPILQQNRHWNCHAWRGASGQGFIACRACVTRPSWSRICRVHRAQTLVCAERVVACRITIPCKHADVEHTISRILASQLSKLIEAY